jgi:hypothetical protein
MKFLSISLILLAISTIIDAKPTFSSGGGARSVTTTRTTTTSGYRPTSYSYSGYSGVYIAPAPIVIGGSYYATPVAYYGSAYNGTAVVSTGFGGFFFLCCCVPILICFAICALAGKRNSGDHFVDQGVEEHHTTTVTTTVVEEYPAEQAYPPQYPPGYNTSPGAYPPGAYPPGAYPPGAYPP